MQSAYYHVNYSGVYINNHTKKSNINFSLKNEESLDSITKSEAKKMHYSRMLIKKDRPYI